MGKDGQANSIVKITLGLCVKNSEKTIKGTLESIISQKYPKELMEMIVVDGCSKDKTLSIVKNITSVAGIRAKILSDKGRGLGAARQMVVNEAKGKYVIFVDGDVELQDGLVREQMKFMEHNPKVGVAIGRYTYKYTRGSLTQAVLSLYDHAEATVISAFINENNATIYRFEALREVGGFDGSFKGAVEDLDIAERIKAKGWILCANEKARFYHKKRESLKGFLAEQSWWGYGYHYFSHKYKYPTSLNWSWHNLPFANVPETLWLASKAYELTHLKIAFLIPVHVVFGRIAWWFGFIKGHTDGYGHEKVNAWGH